MKHYDIAAYIWPSYTGKEPRTIPFWPEGVRLLSCCLCSLPFPGPWLPVRD